MTITLPDDRLGEELALREAGSYLEDVTKLHLRIGELLTAFADWKTDTVKRCDNTADTLARFAWEGARLEPFPTNRRTLPGLMRSIEATTTA